MFEYREFFAGLENGFVASSMWYFSEGIEIVVLGYNVQVSNTGCRLTRWTYQCLSDLLPVDVAGYEAIKRLERIHRSPVNDGGYHQPLSVAMAPKGYRVSLAVLRCRNVIPFIIYQCLLLFMIIMISRRLRVA
jgi:hypothetical protein